MHSTDLIAHGARRRHPVARAMWRYLITGRELHGRGDNATFWHDATTDHRGRPYEKLTRARWRRVARRWSVLLSGAGLSAVYHWYDLTMVVLTITIPTALASLLAVWRAHTTRSRRKVRREYLIPAAKVLGTQTSTHVRRRDVERLIEVPPGWRVATEYDDGPVRVHLPCVIPLSYQLKERIVTSVSATLGIPNATGTWQESGARPYVDIFPPPSPPPALKFADVRKAVESADVNNPVAGMAAKRAVISVDFLQDSPHLSLSGPSGTGKSVFVKFLLAQRLRHGTGTIVLDYKRWSHRWLHDMPSNRVMYLWRIEDIHNGLVAVGKELMRRIECDASEHDSLRSIDIVAEEINSLTKALTRYWKAERRRVISAAREAKENEMDYDPADLDPPLQSPAIVAMQEGVGMGREMRMHWWAVAQRLSASVFGGNGGDIRESFQIRFMAKWDRSLWKMLTNGLRYVAPISGPRGIWGCSIGEDFHIFRVPFLTDGEARTLALSGPPVSDELWRAGETLNVEPAGTPELWTLREASEKLSGVTLGALRRASTRQGFPEAITSGSGAARYWADDVMAWAAGSRRWYQDQISS